MKRSYILCAGLTALTMVFGQMASAQTTWYVATNGTGDGSSWLNAIDNIQGAINKATTSGDIVLVSNGVYETGGVMNYPFGTVLTNRVAITNVIIVRSANNNPTNTIIKGTRDNGTNGPSSVRCVYMTNGSSLIGFTLTNGATMAGGFTNVANDCSGGGVWSPSTNTAISNCVIAGNIASTNGGGAYYGTLYNCTLATNQLISISGKTSWGGGACKSTLYNCMLIKNEGRPGTCYGGAANECKLYNCTLSGGYASYGGGAYNSTLYSCAIISNSVAGGDGAGVRYCILYNCLLMRNAGASSGGGAYQSDLDNCTVVGNSASYGGGSCGGSGRGRLNNCIVYFNTASTDGSNWYGIKTFTNSCVAPEATNGVGNITANPMFVDTNTLNYRLSAVSPCVDTGSNFPWLTDPADARSKDLDGRARSRYGGVDMGAYEQIRAGTICIVR